MGSTQILKVGMFLKPLTPFLNQGILAVHISRVSLSKPSQPPFLARSLSTKDSNPNTRDSGQGFVKKGQDKYKTFNVRRKPEFPKSVFAAGTAKRTTEMLIRKAALASRNEEKPEEERIRKAERMQPPDQPLSAAAWRKLKESHGNSERFAVAMMKKLFQARAHLDVAKSLLTFVAMETGTLSYELLLQYLTLCVNQGHDSEVSDVYDIMQGIFPSLETGASSLFIKSFSRTEKWREAFNILHNLGKVFTPTQRNYSEVISAAMQHGEKTTAWALYDELNENGVGSNFDTWESLFVGETQTSEDRGEEAKAMSQSEIQERLLGILLYMRDNQIYPNHSLASNIKSWFESLTQEKWTGSWTTSSPTGVCRCCGSTLESINLTAEEYQQLKDRVMSDVIEGGDVFKKTTPEELERFKEFVKRKPAFDVVVDGLNIANLNSDRKRLSETLLAVVSELHHKGMNILVLGRKHMLGATKYWNKRHMDLIRQKAHCFFTDNISEDDPFLLYATLHSGDHCLFLSKDLMRDHKACLPDGGPRRLFFKWQRGHQLVVDGLVVPGKKIKFQRVLSYDTIIQRSSDSWHVPFDDTEDRGFHEIPQSWLCLTKKS